MAYFVRKNGRFFVVGRKLNKAAIKKADVLMIPPSGLEPYDVLEVSPQIVADFVAELFSDALGTMIRSHLGEDD